MECWAQRSDADVMPAAEGHVCPGFGPEHVYNGTTCWCGPERDGEDQRIVIHRVAQ